MQVKIVRLFLCSLALCLLFKQKANGELYQWTDTDGSVHFSDNPMSIPKGKRPIVRQDDITSSTSTPSRQLTPTPTKQSVPPKKTQQMEQQTTINKATETNKIQAVWSTLKNAILRKDFETASKQFVPILQDQYKTYFKSSPSEVIARFREIKFIEVYSVDDQYAQCGAIRDDPDGTFSYPLNFARGQNGDWKVYGMQNRGGLLALCILPEK